MHDVCEHVYILYILFIYKNTRYSIKKFQINSYSHSSKYINLFSQYLVLLTGTPRIIQSHPLQSGYPRLPHYAGRAQQLRPPRGPLRPQRNANIVFFFQRAQPLRASQYLLTDSLSSSRFSKACGSPIQHAERGAVQIGGCFGLEGKRQLLTLPFLSSGTVRFVPTPARAVPCFRHGHTTLPGTHAHGRTQQIKAKGFRLPRQYHISSLLNSGSQLKLNPNLGLIVYKQYIPSKVNLARHTNRFSVTRKHKITLETKKLHLCKNLFHD